MGEPGTKEILSLDQLEAVSGLRTGRKHILSILVENKPGVLTRIAGRDGTWAAIPIPFIARLPFAIAIVVWGARTDRRWTVPIGETPFPGP